MAECVFCLECVSERFIKRQAEMVKKKWNNGAIFQMAAGNVIKSFHSGTTWKVHGRWFEARATFLSE